LRVIIAPLTLAIVVSSYCAVNPYL
jgi:hypothetical protein